MNALYVSRGGLIRGGFCSWVLDTTDGKDGHRYIETWNSWVNF